jgi:Fe2+ transport system protein FeoA
MTVPVPLSRVPEGSRCRILGVDAPHHAELAREGLLPGTELAVITRTPLGGPVVVDLGRARLALSASVAAHVATVPVPAARPANEPVR